jgi:hypothetical protein
MKKICAKENFAVAIMACEEISGNVFQHLLRLQSACPAGFFNFTIYEFTKKG